MVGARMRLPRPEGPAVRHSDDGSQRPPPEATLLRIVIDGPDWARRLPAVPPGCVVTATVSAHRLAADRLELEGRGYTFAGVHRCVLAERVEAIDLLVPAAVIADHPGWWRTVAGSAQRAFPLVFGPVRIVLGDLVALHAVAGGTPVR